MTALEKFIEKYETGQTIFIELFKLDDKELAEKIISITDNDFDILTHKFKCVRTIVDGEPEMVKFWFYDELIINWSGINFIHEHGTEQRIVEFNKHFKL